VAAAKLPDFPPAMPEKKLPLLRRANAPVLRLAVLTALVVVIGFLAAAPCEAGLKIYYIRHAEYGHNLVKEYEGKNIPKEKWPAYVGDQNAVTPKGREQTAAVAGKLAPIRFDFIACSPVYRCRQTILPYLRATKQTAEIWPELEEFSSKSLALFFTGELPAPGKKLLAGSPVKIPADEELFFTLRAGSGRLRSVAPSTNRLQRASDTKASLENAIALIRKKFGGTGKTILLSGHGNNGRALIQLLVPETRAMDRSLLHLRNTGIWMAEEQSDGTFVLRILNDGPFEKPGADAATGAADAPAPAATSAEGTAA
jgi:broad specificity phosphatase PhoE